MADRVIPQRELRNHVGEVLREAEAGTQFTITVRGRPVATLGPVYARDRRRVSVPAEIVRERFVETPVDDGFAAEIMRLRELETPAEDLWANE